MACRARRWRVVAGVRRCGRSRHRVVTTLPAIRSRHRGGHPGPAAPRLLWRSQQPVAGAAGPLMTMYWAARSSPSRSPRPFPRDVWFLVLVLGRPDGAGRRHHGCCSPSRSSRCCWRCPSHDRESHDDGDEWTFPGAARRRDRARVSSRRGQPIAFGVHRGAPPSVDTRCPSNGGRGACVAVAVGGVGRWGPPFAGADLHDGAQQRIVAATSTSPPPGAFSPRNRTGRRILDTAVHELHGAAPELRDVSHGVYPPN